MPSRRFLRNRTLSVFFFSHLSVRDMILGFTQVILFWGLYGWMGCSWVFLCSLSAIMTRMVWLVGVMQGGDVGLGENVKTLFSHVPLQRSWAATSTFTFHYSVWRLNRHLSPMLPSLWFICAWASLSNRCLLFFSTVMNGWTRLEPWWLKEICNQHPVKGRDGAAVRPYCSPIKTPTNLDRCKSPNPDYRLFASPELTVVLFTCSGRGAPCCCCTSPSVQLLHPTVD